MDLKEIDVNARNWVDSPQDRNYWRVLVNAALNLRVRHGVSITPFISITFHRLLRGTDSNTCKVPHLTTGSTFFTGKR